MLPTLSLSDVKREVTRAYLQRYAGIPPRHIVGLMFARPESTFAREQVLPHLDHLNRRAGPEVDIFFPGYLRFAPRAWLEEPIVTIDREDGQDPWCYDGRAFNTFVKDLEAETTWKLRDEVVFLLLDSTFSPASESASFDYSRV